MPATITLAQLRALRACQDQRALFKRLFGQSVEVTEDLCVKHTSDFDWDWAARSMLTAPSRAEYQRATEPAWAEYERVRALAWAEYERATALAWAEYKRATELAWTEYQRVRPPTRAEYQRAKELALAEYERATALARAEYERATALAWAEYQRVKALAFARLYSLPGPAGPPRAKTVGANASTASGLQLLREAATKRERAIFAEQPQFSEPYASRP